MPAVQLPPWSNRWLVGAIAVTMLLHCGILYIPGLSLLFSVAPLSAAEWGAILWLSFPVILVDEALKLVTRCVYKRLAHLHHCQARCDCKVYQQLVCACQCLCSSCHPVCGFTSCITQWMNIASGACIHCVGTWCSKRVEVLADIQ